MKKFIAIFTVLILVALVTFTQIGISTYNPVKIKFLKQQGGKPPLKFNYTDLSITNNNDSIRWYVFPYNLNDSLRANGNFKADQPWETGEIGGKKYTDSVTLLHITDVDFIGADQFIAFCIPAKSTMSFGNYIFESWGDTTYKTVQVWEVRNLMVNGIMPLNKWLPYDVVCSNNVQYVSKYGSSWDWSNYDWNNQNNQPRIDYPKEVVTNIQAVGITKYKVKFD